MEQVHGVDVSWMTQGSPKDRLNKSGSPPKSTPASQPRQIPTASTTQEKADAKSAQPNGQPGVSPTSATATPRRLSRSGSIEKQNGPNGTPPGRRNSWFSNISAKFSSGSSNPQAVSTSPQSPQSPPAQGQHYLPHPHLHHHPEDEATTQPESPAFDEPPVPKSSPSRNLVLQHGTKPEGNAPYTPAPPKSGQAGILGVFRRLSSSGGGGGLGPTGKLGNGLVERKILNVDRHRERCPISELSGAKLRRVSFCVDVEIAPMPKYSDSETQSKPADTNKSQKKKLSEKAEGEAFKNAKAAEEVKESGPETDNVDQALATAAAAAESQNNKNTTGSESALSTSPPSESPDTKKKESDKDKDKETSRKKEKKKRSEEERKARKEKRRRLAEDNGSIPMELHFDDSGDSSQLDTPVGSGTPRTNASPTTSPVRMYRRCCQLRETPILKKITEQLMDLDSTNGVVNKLDLTGYWLQLADLITLGDWLAIVPVREVILENIGLTDEGLRVILAGILAAKKPDTKRRKPKHELEDQGGVVERLVLKNNKLGPDGWKHLSLFLYMCRSLKSLDISHVPFPRQAPTPNNGALPNGVQIPRSIADIFSKALAERLGGSTLEMLNIGDTEPSMEQFAVIIDGIIKCKIRRLGFAHNYLDEQGVENVARYLESGVCEGLDLGGNDLKSHIDKLTAAIDMGCPLWALSLAGCNLTPSALGKVLPSLVKLENFRFIDLSHNHDLFDSAPSAVGLLRRYLPKLQTLKRMHLQDVNMTSEQVIALAEIIPEAHQLAHINILENPELVKLAHATTEEAKEEACALFASLMAAARVSKSIVCVDIEVPNDDAGEIVKAMAKQVVAYCLRNMEHLPDANIGAAVAAALSEGQIETADCKPPAYPDVLAHLVGHDVMIQDDRDEDNDSAPDEDYVIGGTGVVKALKCCLENRGGDDSRRQSGEFTLDVDAEEGINKRRLATGGKAKDMSKHLLAGARKIRSRIQPALNKAKANPSDEMNLRKLTFLDETLEGIIKRFEDEFPDTREEVSQAASRPAGEPASPVEEFVPPSLAQDDSAIAVASDGDEEGDIYGPKPLSRSNSMLSRSLATEEARILRAGHRFRSGVAREEYIDLVNTIDEIGSDPKHVHMLSDLAEDIGGDFLVKVKEKGLVRAYKEDRESLLRNMRDADTDHWETFVEAQRKAVQNVSLAQEKQHQQAEHESAIAD